jgi:hypothetical protein
MPRTTAADAFHAKTIWVTGGAEHLGTSITAALDAAGAKTICLELRGLDHVVTLAATIA